MKSFISSLGFVFFLTGFLQAHAHEGHQHDPAPVKVPLAAHLSFDGGNLHAHVSWQKGPEVGAESILKIEFLAGADHSSTEITAPPFVVIDMPSMAHGSAPTIVNPTVDANGKTVKGVYTVSNLYFIMDGEWRIAITLTDEQGLTETQEFFIELGDGDSSGDHDHHHGHHHRDGNDHDHHHNQH